MLTARRSLALRRHPLQPNLALRATRCRRPTRTLRLTTSQLSVEALEDRTLLSVQSAIFALDPSQSSLTLSGTINGSNISQQGSGSLTTRYSGTVAADWDLDNHTIRFDAAGSAATAANSGSWQPDVRGGGGTDPANYGLTASFSISICTVTVWIAVRDVVMTPSTSAPLPLTPSGSEPYTFASTEWLAINQGRADYHYHVPGLLCPSDGHGNVIIAARYDQQNQHPDRGVFQDRGNGAYSLTMPIRLTINEDLSVSGRTIPIRLQLDGGFRANAYLPFVDLSNGSVSGHYDYATRFVAGRGPVHITDPAARATDAGTNTLTSMTVTLTNRPDGAQEFLAANLSGTGLNGSYDPATGTETITGNASTAVYTTVLQSLTYENRSETAATDDRIIRVVVSAGTQSSIVRTSTVSVDATTLLVNNTNDAGPRSLREAILVSNANPGITHRVTFNIGGGGIQTIRPVSPLPTIMNPIIIDGTSQPRYSGTPIIVLSGTNAGPNANGLTITAGGSTVKALVINGFSGNGILLMGNGRNVMIGNYIGTDVSGTAPLGNNNGGVVLAGTSSNTVGGAAAGAGNVISGNAGLAAVVLVSGASGNLVQGNRIGTDANGTHALANSGDGVLLYAAASGNTIGGMAAGARNVIAGNAGFGVHIAGDAVNNSVQGNYIGTNVSGTAPLGNNNGGVVLAGTSSNTVGGAAAAAGNLISGNAGVAAVILVSGASGNLVQGNRIGTDASGTHALANSGDGVLLYAAASNNTIGGTAAGARNVISGNAGFGVHIAGADAVNNVVPGNYIGTDVSGSVPLGNTNGGVVLQGAVSNTVGGAAAGAGNVISGNTGAGITLVNTGTSGNIVQGNYIGTDASGTNPLGNGAQGISIFDQASSNTVGGTAPGAGNLISGNGASGIAISSAGTSGNVVQGNYIGANGRHGVVITEATNNAIGGFEDGAGNTIAYHGIDGVLVDTGTGNGILGNSIFGHQGLGIELVNGGNHFQEFPVLTSVISGNGSTTIGGTLTSAPYTQFVLEFFADSICNPSGYGEGEQFLGRLRNVMTDMDGNASFTITLDFQVSPDQFLAATATDSGNNTSQFSQCVTVTSPSSPRGVASGRRGILSNTAAFAEEFTAFPRTAWGSTGGDDLAPAMQTRMAEQDSGLSPSDRTAFTFDHLHRPGTVDHFCVRSAQDRLFASPLDSQFAFRVPRFEALWDWFQDDSKT